MEDRERYISNAIRWAKEQLGSKEYLTLCLAFVEDAYENSNNVEIFGGSTAKESADEYGASDNRGVPEKGAFVFYDCFGTINDEYENWGHVGLCIGNGQVIHAWDIVRVEHYKDIEELKPAPGWTSPKYIGWAAVDRVFKGYRVL